MQFFFRFCAGDIDEYMDIFLDTKATKEAMIQAGIAIFQYIYHGPDTTLGRNSLQHVLKESNQRLYPNKGCSCTACTLCLPADPGLDPSREHVSKPQWLWMDIRCTWVWASSNTEYHGPWGSTEVHQRNCHGDCSDRRCMPVAARRMGSCASQPVESAKALHAKKAVIMLLSLKKIDNDSWSFRHCG